MYRVGRIYHRGLELIGDVVLFGIFYTRHALKQSKQNTQKNQPKPLKNGRSEWSFWQRVSVVTVIQVLLIQDAILVWFYI